MPQSWAASQLVDASKDDVVEALKDLTGGRGVDVAVDYVSSTATLEAGAKALGKHGRLVTLGGAGKAFQLSAMDLLFKEQQRISRQSLCHPHRGDRIA